MNIKDIKKEMKDYIDFFGGSLISYERIDYCKTKKELSELIDEHNNHMEGMLTDAQSSLSRFKQKLTL